MSGNASTTVLRCPCCRRLLAATDANTQHWRTNNNSQATLRKSKSFLNLVLSQKIQPERSVIRTDGTQDTMRNKEAKVASQKREDKRSLLYNTEWFLASRRVDNLMTIKREDQLKVAARKSLLTNRYSYKYRDLVGMDDHDRLGQARDFKAVTSNSHNHLLPKIATITSHGMTCTPRQNKSRSPSTTTSATVAMFEERRRIKLDIYLPSVLKD